MILGGSIIFVISELGGGLEVPPVPELGGGLEVPPVPELGGGLEVPPGPELPPVPEFARIGGSLKEVRCSSRCSCAAMVGV